MNTNPEDGLTLPEARLQAEGEALIKSLSDESVKLTPILGPDGKPLEGVQLATGKAPPEAEAQAREQVKEGMQKKLTELRKISRAEIEAALLVAGEVLDENPLALRCSKALLALHQALAWCKLELQLSDERIDDTVLTHMERQVQAAVYQGNGFDAKLLLDVLPNSVIALIEKQSLKYQRDIKNRRNRIRSTISQYEFNGKTLVLPTVSMMESFPNQKVQLGSLVVVTGRSEAVRAALLVCLDVHRLRNQGESHYFVAEGMPKIFRGGVVSVAQVWWQDALTTFGRFYKRFNIVVESRSSAIAIDDFNPLLCIAIDQMAHSERVSRIFSALQQWAVENAVLVFIGAPGEYEKAPNYNLPQFAASIEEVDGKKVLKFAGEQFSI